MVVVLKQLHTAGCAQRITSEYVELVDKSLSTRVKKVRPIGYKQNVTQIHIIN
jgi:hypothetical protein